MTLEEDLKKAELEFGETFPKAKQEYDKKFREVSDRAELKLRKKINELKAQAIQRHSMELRK